MTFKKTLAATGLALAVGFGFTAPAFSAEPIVGVWKRNNGTQIKFSGSGSNYCGRVLNGKYKGKSIGCLRGKNGKYRGKINVLDEGKTYTGKATASASSMKLSGCVAVFCKSETLRRVR